MSMNMFGEAFNSMFGLPSNKLMNGSFLNTGQPLQSKNMMYQACVQMDGNLAVYTLMNYLNPNTRILYSTNIQNKGYPPYRLTLQPDGFLSIFDANYYQIWKSPNSAQGMPPYSLIIEDTGILNLYDGMGAII